MWPLFDRVSLWNTSASELLVVYITFELSSDDEGRDSTEWRSLRYMSIICLVMEVSS